MIKQDRFWLVEKFVKLISKFIVGSWEQIIAYFDTYRARSITYFDTYLNQFRIFDSDFLIIGSIFTFLQEN